MYITCGGGRNCIPINDAEFDRWLKFFISCTEQKRSGNSLNWDHTRNRR
ncbi:MAG: hypothetical protein LBK73_15510 [Treponema sp.]|nr:hypothetical protein [Treponema sp.]